MIDPMPLLKVRDLTVSFASGDKVVRAVDGVSLSLRRARTLAVVGESGSGKSVTALSILRLLPPPPHCRIERGEVLFDGRDLLRLPMRDMLRVRGAGIAMIFQEPMTSLNPVFTIGEQIIEAIRRHHPHVLRLAAKEMASAALREVGIEDPLQRQQAYPHQFSGGMRQRVMIAMALACQPKVLLADEPTTALDVTIAAQILDLLQRLQRERGLAIMLITHDLGIVKQRADDVCVMYAGRVVESGSVEEVLNRPLHPYTIALLKCRPRLGQRVDRLSTIADVMGETRSLRLPGGEEPWWPAEGGTPRDQHPCVMREVAPQHWVACVEREEASVVG
jgi:peptide/nickel transport system ATP-binding protein